MTVGKDLKEQESKNNSQVQESKETESPRMPTKPAGTRMGTFLNWRSGENTSTDKKVNNRLRNGK